MHPTSALLRERSAGILLHPTSLPGKYGIGDLGQEAYAFIDFLAASGQKLWQVLPLGPTSYGDSPYQCLSALAGNPYLISPEKLVQSELLSASVLNDIPAFPKNEVDFGWVIQWKWEILKKSFTYFREKRSFQILHLFEIFCKNNAEWLDDYALFSALKSSHEGKPWNMWPEALAERKEDALREWHDAQSAEVEFHKFTQFVFYQQWQALLNYAHEKKIHIVGDLPIFVAYDSADVWSNQKYFFLDEHGNPTVVAGVPPDYFSETGQLWGNPLYRWDVMRADDYQWWQIRLKILLRQVDLIRIDHFRGFDQYWEVPASEKTAIKGRWVDGPKAHFFERIEHHLGELPIIAEDLGLITPAVHALRDEFDFPGMRILQFAFSGDASDIFLPHNYVKNTVVYTGTHDNNTTLGWFEACTVKEQENLSAYFGVEVEPTNICPLLIRLALASVANMAIIPLQDLLNKDESARMNFPSKPSGNWMWRFQEGELVEVISLWLKKLTKIYHR